MVKESAIVNAIMKRARSLGFWVTKIHGGNYQRSGLPDLLCIKGGRAFWLEVKRPDGKPTKLQLHTIAELQAFGCIAEVVYSLAEAEEVLSV
jgi:Holliday junction resolvase